MEQSTFIVHWKGPYSEAELEKLNDGNGLYFITGIQYRKRTSSMIQYFGITKGKLRDRIKRHHKVEEITRERQFWFGKFAYPNQFSREQLEMVENILIYFWQPELNDKKKAKIKKPIVLVSYWFKSNGSIRTKQHPLCKDLPDVLSWDGENWRTGNLSVYPD